MNRSPLLLLLTMSLLIVLPACADPDTGDDTSDAGACEQTYEGHATCNAENGDLFFCGDDGNCIEASGCLALSCCLPGEGGDEWCASQFGEGNVCAIVNNDGQCT
jgi:hypothetical protein